MKKLLAILLALAMVLTLVACGDKPNNDGDDKNNPDSADNNKPGDNDNSDDNAEDENAPASALEVMTSLWEAYPGDENGDKFMSFGGDYENNVENAPAAHTIADGGTELDASIGYPAAMIEKIDEAVALRHMMNVNTFTSGAYHLVNASDAQAVSDGIVDALMNRSYICGAPQWLVVMCVHDNYIVSVFGAEDLVNAFKDTAVNVYGDNVTILHDATMEGAHGDNGIDLGGLGIGF